MQILHKLDILLFELFPKAKEAGNSIDILKDELTAYYSYGPYKPTITIEGEWVSIDIDTPSIISQESDYNKVVAFCEKGEYTEAKRLLDELISKNPTYSDYHRIYGQILSDEGDQDEAINHFIDALRWDSKNRYALIMMGNVFSRHYNDIETALKYYNQALEVYPDDYISINNIGANLMKYGKTMEAKKYFAQALSINPDYPNTHFAISLVAEGEHDYNKAFNSAIEAMKCNTKVDDLYQNCFTQAMKVAKMVLESKEGIKVVNEYARKLENEGTTAIEFVEDSNLKTAAKIEYAENYGRNKHLVIYKPKYPAVEHLQMHELVHLDFAIQARNEDTYQLFISTQEQKAAFIKSQGPTIEKLIKMGLAKEAVDNYLSSLFDGMNTQVYNAPIDLFIEDFIYNEYPDLRPIQFISLQTLIWEAIKAMTDTRIIEFAPKDVMSVSKIYNIVSALQFKELYGIDLIKEFKATPGELKQAQVFYDEFEHYKEDKEPGEEYELLLHWAADLNLDKNFELANESEYLNKRTNLEGLIASIERDPFDLDSKDPNKEREMENFQRSQTEIGINMAVVMYMVEALEYFKGKPKEKIVEVAMEIAMMGTQGFRPDQESGYRVGSIPGKDFSGYHILAYYYVSWKIVSPEILPQLKLPYDEEFKLAEYMHKQKNQ